MPRLACAHHWVPCTAQQHGQLTRFPSRRRPCLSSHTAHSALSLPCARARRGACRWDCLRVQDGSVLEGVSTGDLAQLGDVAYGACKHGGTCCRIGSMCVQDADLAKCGVPPLAPMRTTITMWQRNHVHAEASASLPSTCMQKHGHACLPSLVYARQSAAACRQDVSGPAG